jgi:UDP-glucose 4-epimerase
MRILVTGGLGVNGAVVTRQLVDRGIRPLVTDYRADFSLVPGLRDQFDFVEGDITKPDFVAGLLGGEKIDAIIHLAAYIAPDMDNEPYPSFMINCVGSAYLLENALKSGIKRFVAAGSRAVYGALPDNVGAADYRPIDEEHPKRPTKAYDVTKLAAEQLGQVYRRSFGMEYAALRFAGIYGPGKQARHGKMSLRSRLVEDPLEGKPVLLPRGGDQQDDMIYVEDAAAALIEAALAPRLNFSAYNIGSGIGQTLRQFADAVKAAIPDAVIEIGPGGNALGFDDNRAAIFDITRAREDFGYTPKYDLVAGVADNVARLRHMRRFA